LLEANEELRKHRENLRRENEEQNEKITYFPFTHGEQI
jgi:hypothetical protein